MASQGWQLVSVELSGEVRAGISLDGEFYLPAELLHCAGVLDVMRSWSELEGPLHAWTPQAGERVTGARTLMPLAFPNKVLCSGPNFTDHLAEMGESGLGEEWSAYFFLKPPSTTLIGDGEPILIDDVEGSRVDWEGELAVVIGRGGRRIDAADAIEHVAGYLVSNDISLRGPHRRNTPARPFEWDWVASKAADTSLPISNGVVPRWQVPDPQSLTITTRVNGELKQDGRTSNMVLDVAQLVADASHLVTLEPGDLILTGTPAGVGASTGTFLADGDIVEVSIAGVGSVRNRVQQR